MPAVNFQDAFHFLSKMTLRKGVNSLKVFVSFLSNKYLHRNMQWGMPFSISLEPTTSCNLRCPECPSGLRSFTRPTGMLQKDFFRKVIDEMEGYLLYLIFYFQGEPYLNPDFLEMVRYASDKKIYTATSTNAHYLNDENAKKTVESGLDRLIISIDGTTQDVYKQYRIGGHLDKVIEGAARVVKWRKELKSKKPFILFQFLVVRPNEHQIEEVKKMAREIGVDEVRFKTAQIYDFENGNRLIPTLEKYSRYKKKKDGTYAIKNKLGNHCWKLSHSCVITWDGQIVPCCFDKDAQHRLGDLKQQTFRAIWHGEAYRDFRTKLFKGRKHIDICANCSDGTSVWS